MPKMTVAQALRQAIREEMQRDERVFCIGEDIGIPGGFGGAFTVTLGLSDEFGHDRILDTPISEIGIAGVAVGAAIGGLRPIADVQYGDFLFCMMDQLVNQAAKMHYMSGGTVTVPMVMRAPVGAT
ncbi:MAG TPA: alpha-ketoacid dehydrogenase subunit beta, partial [Anaerolineae bacterium]|nr:alpha-ketoacid dehydrogenase subunit beta [Anaerolineae bacterium]